jgi:hypothetical protein
MRGREAAEQPLVIFKMPEKGTRTCWGEKKKMIFTLKKSKLTYPSVPLVICDLYFHPSFQPAL